MRSKFAVALLVACGSRTQLDGASLTDANAPLDASATEDVNVANLPPSCHGVGPGLSDCGVDHDSCCTTLDVPGGTFFRTYLYEADHGLTGQADPATVSAFRLDKYLVTVARFRLFVEAWKSGWTPPAGSGKHAHLNQGEGLANVADVAGYEPGWNTSDDGAIAPTDVNLSICRAYEDWPTWTSAPALPINCVTWYEAEAFCIWDGGFLPSEAEWVFAAAGGNEQRLYPWGATNMGSVPATQTQYAIFSCNFGPGPSYALCAGAKDATDLIARVGMTAQGRAKWGHFDLAGDVSEYTIDSFAGYRPCTDCAYMTSDAGRAGHGGDFVNPDALIHPWYRLDLPGSRGAKLGFRCARRPAH